jgi:hypothetical protein
MTRSLFQVNSVKQKRHIVLERVETKFVHTYKQIIKIIQNFGSKYNDVLVSNYDEKLLPCW